MLLVRGKGGKERLVPLSAAARAAAERWLAGRKKPAAGCSPAAIGRRR